MGSDPAVRFDLQGHSTHSDGALPPAEVVRRAAQAGVELFALTDHDTVDGVAEALAAGEQVGIRVIPAVEISAVDGELEDLHLLGYGIDHEDPGLLSALESFRADRGARAERMVEALEELGLAVDRAALEERRARDLPVGRPHIAAAAFNHPDNAARVAEEGLGNPSELLERYLIPGAPAYRRRTRPTVAEAIEIVHAAGGLAVWAHPFWDLEDPEAVIGALERYAAAGVDGVEAFYPTHDAEQAGLLYDAAVRLDLQTTGSADFHGPEHPTFSRFAAFDTYGLTPRLDRLLAGR
jgi:hypothetical protein